MKDEKLMNSCIPLRSQKEEISKKKETKKSIKKESKSVTNYKRIIKAYEKEFKYLEDK